MTKKIVLFNNKGGVGKTTFLFHLGYALEKKNKKILFVDLDPQCNLSSHICSDEDLEGLWKEKNSIYNSVEPLIKGTGDVRLDITPYKVKDRNIYLMTGDILLSEYEEILSNAWIETLAGNERGFRISSAIYRLIENFSDANKIDYVLIDVGPNLGSLNRNVLLSCDYFFIPLVPDLFSLRGLENIGKTFVRWIKDWVDAKKRFIEKVGSLSFPLQEGSPKFTGYIQQQFNIYNKKETKSWNFWTKKVPNSIKQNITDKMSSIGLAVDINEGSYKLGDFRNFHSLVPKAQKEKKPIFDLGPNEGVSGDHINRVKECEKQFEELSQKIIDKLPGQN